MIVTIKSAEVKQGGRGDYLSIRYIDTKDNSEHGKAVFNTLKEKWGMVTNGATLEFKLDTKYNITDILPVADKLPPPVTPKSTESIKAQAVETPPPPLKDNWVEKDKITRKSFERQTSLNASVEVAKLMGADKMTTDKIIATAKRFEAYLEYGVDKEVQPVKSRLVEEARKLGATEIKEGG